MKYENMLKLQISIRSIIGFTYTTRFITSGIVGLYVILPSLYKGYNAVGSLLAALPFVLSAMGGFALNDYHDSEKDKINKPHRAIPSGKIARASVKTISLILLGSAMALGLLISQNIQEAFLYIAAVVGVSLYNVIVKKLALAKTVYTATISSLPVTYAVLVFGYPTIFVLLPIAAVFFIIGRELLMDVNDIKGDRISGIKTIPMALGENLTVKLGFWVQFAGLILLFPLVLSTDILKSVLAFISILFSIIFAYTLWDYKSPGRQYKVILFLRLPMLFGIMLLMQ